MLQSRKYQGWKGGQVHTNKKQGWLGSHVMADLEAEVPHEEVTNKRGQGRQVGIHLESSERRRQSPEVRGHRGAEERVDTHSLPLPEGHCAVRAHTRKIKAKCHTLFWTLVWRD